MNTCCTCCIKNKIQQHKENLKKEFKNLIMDWLKKHPEISKVHIYDNSNYIFHNSITISQDSDINTLVYFD